MCMCVSVYVRVYVCVSVMRLFVWCYSGIPGPYNMILYDMTVFYFYATTASFSLSITVHHCR